MSPFGHKAVSWISPLKIVAAFLIVPILYKAKFISSITPDIIFSASSASFCCSSCRPFTWSTKSLILCIAFIFALKTLGVKGRTKILSPPASTLSIKACSLSILVIKISGASVPSPESFFILRVASNPSIMGILISIKTRSG